MTVVFVGDKPSRLNKDPNVAFVGAKCYPRLLKWLNYMDVENPTLLNSHTLELMVRIIQAEVHGYKIVALGNTTSKRLRKAGVKHYKMDHPSGLNRKLNDKQYELDMLNKCREWLYENN